MTLGELAVKLRAAHKFVNGCWYTDYATIPGLRLRASTTNGDSGLGIARGIGPVYWTKNSDGSFTVQRD